MQTHSLKSTRLSVLWTALAATGCASVPGDWGRGQVIALAETRGIEVPAPDDPRTDVLVNELLSEPLTAEAAVRIALLRNPALRATYARLGFAAADVYEAGRLSNPTLSVASLDSSEAGAADQLTFGLAQSFADLLLLHSRSRIARGEFERVQLAVAGEIFDLSVDVEGAFYHLAGARQLVEMRGAIVEATQVSAELAQRFFAAGNLNRLELALERAAASEARLGLLEAQAEATQARNALNRLLGLPREAAWCIGNGLPAPPAHDDQLETLYALADASRLDLAAARREVELAADALGVTRTWRWLGVLDVGVERERETDGERITGPTLAIELPLWNQNADRVTRAEAQLMLSQAQSNALVLRIADEVQLAHAEAQQARARIAELQQSLLPLREEIVERAQEQVNYMLMGVFDLLRLKQQEYDGYAAYLMAVRDYWLARTELKRAVGAPLPSSAQAGASRIDAGELAVAARRTEHSNHGEHSMAGQADHKMGLARTEPGSAAREPVPDSEGCTTAGDGP